MSMVAAPDFDHIKVAIRCRPLNDEEKDKVQVIIKTDGDKLIAFYPESKEGLLYNYDYLFPEETNQRDVFNVLGMEMCELVMGGYNTCCLAYGASSAGKTHTLFGSDTEHGLIQMTTKELFKRIDAQPHPIKSAVTLQYWEMNNDYIRDALNTANTANLSIRKNPAGGVYIPGLTEVEANTWEELDKWLMTGNIARIQLSEERQARWHGFLKIKVVQSSVADADRITSSTLLFGHLKGPDRVGQKGATGSILQHGSSVNKSISLLGAAMLHVVDMRRRKLNQTVVAADEDEEATAKRLRKTHRQLAKESESLFAESKLTQVLMEPLSGMCGTIVLANVSTTDYHETTDILENLQNAQQITVALKRGVKITSAGKIHKELEQARSVAGNQSMAQGHPLTEIEEKVRKLEEQYQYIVAGSERPETPPNKQPPPKPAELPRGPRWKQHNVVANKHGNRATVYIPTAAGKNTYKGQWANSMKEGYGEQVTPLSRYVGQWRSNMRDGEGTLWCRATASADWQRVYKGGWRADKRHGLGTNWYPNGDIYEGYWADGKRSGIGKLYLANGDKIEGQWRGDKTGGWASLYLKDGDWFEGHWHNGLREGPGVWYYESKEQMYKGTWHLGVAKCGSIEDMPRKTANTHSHFLPRCGLTNADAALAQTCENIKVDRMRLAIATGDQYADELNEEEEDIEEDAGMKEVDHRTMDGTLQHDIDEYIEVMDGK
eukprot:NODE_77_length_2585_cov_257.872634_g58_i0.p1 GENE.NODE_77_length_2585_cov_257.872634_g58_i0~~NODE_77_length_2585_cov_257.872634_g58_i0.p1  ORF type:complete len:719 (+),score=189.56 NODE_77_length_2585_cov_257.872634_g58_i0:113-2269(+)